MDVAEGGTAARAKLLRNEQVAGQAGEDAEGGDDLGGKVLPHFTEAVGDWDAAFRVLAGEMVVFEELERVRMHVPGGDTNERWMKNVEKELVKKIHCSGTTYKLFYS